MSELSAWWSETATIIASVIAASAAGRMLFIGYQFKEEKRHIVFMWLLFELFAAAFMGLLALGAISVLQQVFQIDFVGWPSYSLAAVFGWLGPKGLQGVVLSFSRRGKK